MGSDLVGAITRGPDGDLWIATFNGLSRFHAGKFHTYRVKDGLSSNIITALHRTRHVISGSVRRMPV